MGLFMDFFKIDESKTAKSLPVIVKLADVIAADARDGKVYLRGGQVIQFEDRHSIELLMRSLEARKPAKNRGVPNK